ncbi:MAG: hypothetical protein U0984_19580 [Prosthecobacter sp.]|nr:hypothetical protein [Prosthecobacter sp.]
MKTALVVFVMALPHIPWGSVSACSCSTSAPPLKAMARTDCVFTGKVTMLKEIENPVRLAATITVTKRLKGEMPDTVLVTTGFGGGDCGFPFEQGESYLIYAQRQKDGILYTNICMRTGFLKDAATEILELEGRLPKLRHPSTPPSLRLVGKIEDAGYNGLIFSLENTLHDRIFLFSGSTGTHRVQVQVDGSWIDYAPNWTVSPRKALASKEEAAALERWKQSYEGMETKGEATYLNRMSAMREFIAIPTTSHTWRVGIEYITEAEFDAGKEIQQSGQCIWSEAIVPQNVQAPELTFEKAFTREAAIPHPLGAPK